MPENKGESELSPEIAKLSDKLLKDRSSKLFFPLAEEYIKSGMLEEAIAVLKDGLRIHPGFYAARVSLGKVYFQKGRVAEAKAEFEKVTAKHPDNLLAQKKLVLIYRDEGAIEKARQICESVLLTNPKDDEIRELFSDLQRCETEKSAEAISQTSTEGDLSVQMPEGVEDICTVNQQADEAEAESVLPLSVEPQSPPEKDREVVHPESIASQIESEIHGTETPSQETASPTHPPFEAIPDSQTPQASAPASSYTVEEPSHQIPKEQTAKPQEFEGPGENNIGGGREEHEIKMAASSEEQRANFIAPGSERREGNLEEDVFYELLGTSSVRPLAAHPETPDGSEQELPDEDRRSGIDEDVPGPETVAIAELYIRQGHYEQGIEIYRKILEHDPDNAEVRQRLEDALDLANLLTKRTVEIRRTLETSMTQEPPEEVLKASSANISARSSPEQMRQAKILRLQAWLEQLKRGQNQ
jgi:tetratricopeptide (TPR) repeat protein